jgi:hypothetical protein
VFLAAFATPLPTWILLLLTWLFEGEAFFFLAVSASVASVFATFVAADTCSALADPKFRCFFDVVGPQVGGAAPRHAWAAVMLAWLVLEVSGAYVVAGITGPFPKSFGNGASSIAHGLAAPRAPPRSSADDVPENHMLGRPHVDALLAVCASIAVSVHTGGDAGSAALACAGVRVALGVLHHVGRVILACWDQ